MRLTTVLRAQHIGRMFKKHWLSQGKRKILDTRAENILAAKGIRVVDALEVVVEKEEITPYV